jgi:hypothetical protein
MLRARRRAVVRSLAVVLRCWRMARRWARVRKKVRVSGRDSGCGGGVGMGFSWKRF